MQGVANRDLKLENLLLHKDVRNSRRPLLKICDFGYSKHELNSPATSGVGTPIYMAPEIIYGISRYDAKVAPRSVRAGRVVLPPPPTTAVGGRMCAAGSRAAEGMCAPNCLPQPASHAVAWVFLLGLSAKHAAKHRHGAFVRRKPTCGPSASSCMQCCTGATRSTTRTSTMLHASCGQSTLCQLKFWYASVAAWLCAQLTPRHSPQSMARPNYLCP